VPDTPVVPVAFLTGAALVAVPLLRDAEVETGLIFEGVPTALVRLSFVFGDSFAACFPLSAAEGDVCAADAVVPSALEFDDAAGTLCFVSGLRRIFVSPTEALPLSVLYTIINTTSSKGGQYIPSTL
jgi:hypothetical protein